MPISSVYPPIQIPEVDILSYIFPENETPSTEPIWLDAADTSRAFSPAELLQWVKRLGFGLEKSGAKKGDVIMIFTPNSIMVPVAYLGIVSAGFIFSGANAMYTSQELAHQMRDTGANIILAHPSTLRTTIAAAEKVGLSKSNIYQFAGEGECPVTEGVHDWRKLLGTIEQGNSWSWKRLGPKEIRTTIATMNYSSGTTGLPKGVCVSHYNLVANVEQGKYMRYLQKPESFRRNPERWIGFLPLYHAYGQLYTVLMAAKLRIQVYIMKQFIYTDFLAAMEKYKITTLQAAPPILVMLSKRPETKNYDLSSMKDVICAAAPLSKELQNDIARNFKCNVVQGWGMTEVTCGGIMCPGGLFDDSGSVGQLMPNTECKLIDDDGNEVKAGEAGEMCVRGPQVSLGYWRNDKATKETITPDGWLKTGDIVVYNKEGFFWIVDRKKELIKVNGLQVAPAELESILLENEHIADAGVVGIILHGEEWPRAYVTLQPAAKGKVTPDDIQDWIRPRVAKHKQLVGGVALTDEIPRLASGKIQRKMMREWAKRDAKDVEVKFTARL